MINYIQFLFFISFTHQALNPLDFKTAGSNFKENVMQFASSNGFTVTDLKQNSDESMSVFLGKNNIGAAKICFKQQITGLFGGKNDDAKTYSNIVISGIQDQNIEIKVDNYIKEEWLMLNDAVNEMVYRLSNLDISNDGIIRTEQYVFNSIETVRNHIQEISKKQNKQLDFQEEINDNNLKMKLYSDEGLVMKIEGNITNEQKGDQPHFIATNYFLNLKIDIVQQDQFKESNIQIPIITKNSSVFGAEMNKVVQYLELDKYSNNNLEHEKNLLKYMQQYYPHMEFTDVAKQAANGLTFLMKYENTVYKGILNYVDAETAGRLGKYALQIVDNVNTENVIKSFEFERAYVTTINKTFTENGLNNLFEPIHEKILKIFEEEYAKIIQPNINQDLQKDTSGSGSSKSFIRKNNTLKFTVQPSNNSVTISYESKTKKYNVSQKYEKGIFDEDITRDLIQHLLKAQLKFSVSKNLIL